MLSTMTRFPHAGLRRHGITLGAAGPHSSGMAANMNRGVGFHHSLQRFVMAYAQPYVPERTYVNFSPQGPRPATERYWHPVTVGRDRSCPTMTRPVSNQTSFNGGSASIDYVNGGAAAKTFHPTLYERASKAFRHLIDNIRVVGGAHAGVDFEYPPIEASLAGGIPHVEAVQAAVEAGILSFSTCVFIYSR